MFGRCGEGRKGKDDEGLCKGLNKNNIYVKRGESEEKEEENYCLKEKLRRGCEKKTTVVLVIEEMKEPLSFCCL